MNYDKNVNGINRADMIFAMAKEYALNLKGRNGMP